MMHIFHIYVASVLSGYCICLHWFSSVFRCFLSVSEASVFLFYVASVVSGCFKSRLDKCSGSPSSRCGSDF
jgi:hypothetical protein